MRRAASIRHLQPTATVQDLNVNTAATEERSHKMTRTAENSYIYDAFGNTLKSRETIENCILYTGQQYDQETGQYYLRARFYNPVIGRFMQEDTYRGDGLNLYAYCGNNPVMYYDPNGHQGIGKCKLEDQAKGEEPPVNSEARGNSKNPNGYAVGAI